MKKILLIMIGLFILLPLVANAQDDGKWHVKFKKNSEVTKDIIFTTLDSITFAPLDGPPVCDIQVSAPMINLSKVGEKTFTVIVTYSEAMSDNAIPIIKFDPHIKDLEEVGAGTWNDDYTEFTMQYDVTGLFETEEEDVDVTVSNARDKTGNLQDPCTKTAAFDVDLLAPSISLINVYDIYVITDEEVGMDYKVEISYSEEMDEGNLPNIYFSAPVIGANKTFAEPAQEWTNKNKKFVSSYHIADMNADYDTLYLYVDMGEDLAGNPAELDSADRVFEIDTRNPKVSSLISNISDIDQSNVNDEFIITITFDENMDKEKIPAIEFSPKTGTVLTSTFEGEWDPNINSNIFTKKWNINLDDVNIQDISIEVSKAYDLNGNEIDEYIKEKQFNIGMSNIVVFDDSFEDYSQGTYPDSYWDIQKNLSDEKIIVIANADLAHTGDKLVSMQGNAVTPPLDTAMMSRPITEDPMPDVIEIAGYIMPTGATDKGGIAFGNKLEGEIYASVEFSENRFHWRVGNNAGTIPTDYYTDQWHKIKFVYDETNMQIAVWIDDEQKIQAETTTATTLPGVGYDNLTLYSENGTIYFDDVKVWYRE